MNYIIWFIALIVLGYGTFVSGGVTWGVTFLWFCQMVKGWVAAFWGIITIALGYLLIRTIINHPF